MTEPADQTPPPPKRWHKTPSLLQMEAVECGAAALGIVLGFHGLFVPLEELRRRCGVSRDGSKASNMVKAARTYGTIARGFRYESTTSLYELDFPVILFWNMNHFVVLEGFHRGQALVNDPASGRRKLSIEELDQSFSGVVLSIEPGPEFVKGGRRPSTVAALGRRLAGAERALAFAVLCGLFLVVPGLIIPTFARVFIDEILIADRTAFLEPLLIGIALTALLRMGLSWLQSHCLLRMETRIALLSSASFFHHVLRLPVSYFSQRYAGEIGSRVMINDKVAKMVSGRLATTVLDSVLVVFYVFLMFLYHVPLTLLCLTIAVLNIVALRATARARSDSSMKALQEAGKLTGTAMNGLRIIESVKASGLEDELFARWAGYQAKSLRAQQEMSELSEASATVPPMVNALTTATILLVGGMAVMNGDLTMGMLVAYQSLAASFAGPLGSLVNFGATIQQLEADMNRLDDVLNHDPDQRYRAGHGDGEVPQELQRVKLSGEVELRDVCFGYNPLDPPLIRDFNLHVRPGQRVALVGASGSGKSTVARLLTGLYRPWSGQLLFDGTPSAELSSELIINSLAAVDQDIFLFGGTVGDNVTMWDDTIPEARVTEACRDACVDDVIQNREGTYASLVDEGGGNFSGGQRQRLEIARALVGNPTILVLDEATSALDPTTELAIDDALRRRGCTCIVVAHRLSTIRDCDEIIVMDRGSIVQRGTHEEMKNAEGPYADLMTE